MNDNLNRIGSYRKSKIIIKITSIPSTWLKNSESMNLQKFN